MHFEIYHHHIKDEIKAAKKHIRKANRGLPQKVKFMDDFKLIKLERQNWVSLQMFFTDGNGEPHIYSIAM